MNGRMHGSAGRMALSGMLSALIVSVLYFAGISEVASLSVLAVAGVILCVCVYECGMKFAVSSYIATSLLGLLVCADKITAGMYVICFGLYSILKSVAETRISKRIAEWAAKIIFFNLSLVLMLLAAKVMMLDTGILKTLPGWAWTLGWIVLNGVFLIYDIALTRLMTFYIFRLRRKLFRKS